MSAVRTLVSCRFSHLSAAKASWMRNVSTDRSYILLCNVWPKANVLRFYIKKMLVLLPNTSRLTSLATAVKERSIVLISSPTFVDGDSWYSDPQLPLLPSIHGLNCICVSVYLYALALRSSSSPVKLYKYRVDGTEGSGTSYGELPAEIAMSYKPIAPAPSGSNHTPPGTLGPALMLCSAVISMLSVSCGVYV